MSNTKHITIKQLKKGKKKKQDTIITVVKRNNTRRKNNRSPIPVSNKPINIVMYPSLSNLRPVQLNNYFTINKSNKINKANIIHNILSNKSNKITKHNIYNALTNFFLHDEVAQFFAWLDSNMVTSHIAPTIKAIYKHPHKIPIKPDCLTQEQYTYRKMVAKCIRYGEDCVTELIKYFIKHYEDIIERTDRCGLNVTEFIKIKLEVWTSLGMPFVI